MTLTACKTSAPEQTYASNNDKPHIKPIDWHQKYSPVDFYYNKSDTILNLRSGPGTDFARKGVLQPGEGGHINGCDKETMQWCYIRGKTLDGSGWVDMSYMSTQKS